MDLKYFSKEADPLIEGLEGSILRLIDDARGKAGVPFRITSGRRSPDSNSGQKDSVKNSAHLTGRAVDLDCRDSHRLWCMIFGLMNVGARRIGVYVTRCEDNPNRLIPRHIHVDDDPDKPQEVLFLQMEQ